VLIKAGADLHATNEHARTAFHLAAAYATTETAHVYGEVIKVLCHAGAPGDVYDCYRKTPLDYVRKGGHEAIISQFPALMEERKSGAQVDRLRAALKALQNG
jgi:hypothetical protein